MTDTIAPHEYGKVRVFQLAYQLDSEIAPKDDYDRLGQALGAKIVTEKDVQIVHETALHDLGLAQFLMLGYGITEAEIAPQMDMLNSLKGSFAIIRSGAFGDQGATLNTNGDAKLVATFTEEGAAPPALTPLTSDSSQGTLTPPTKAPKSDARIGGMVATVVLLLMGIFVWLMIWIGG